MRKICRPCKSLATLARRAPTQDKLPEINVSTNAVAGHPPGPSPDGPLTPCAGIPHCVYGKAVPQPPTCLAENDENVDNDEN
ncbi:MAG: hypothetical protein K2L22_03605 [Muribaculaceae bacterium]|nr:hypothetical protein [Muribaculaceae bacterium]